MQLCYWLHGISLSNWSVMYYIVNWCNLFCKNCVCDNMWLFNCKYNIQIILCPTDIDDCIGHQCLNNGTCTDELDGYTCHCQLGITGSQCQTGKLIPVQRTFIKNKCDIVSKIFKLKPFVHQILMPVLNGLV